MRCPRLLAILALPILLGAAGCSRGNFLNDNDALRAQVIDLEAQITALRAREAELTAELVRTAAVPGSLPQEIRENIPHVTSIKVDRLSHADDSDRDGRIDRIVLYVKPLDGRSRFTHMVGHLAANAALLPNDADAMTIGRVELSPGEVREAYRYTMLGQFYTIVVPVSLPPQHSHLTAAVQVTFRDGLTGQTHVDQAEIPLNQEPPAPVKAEVSQP